MNYLQTVSGTKTICIIFYGKKKFFFFHSFHKMLHCFHTVQLNYMKVEIRSDFWTIVISTTNDFLNNFWTHFWRIFDK